jgi:hypothetical protein
MLRCYSGLVIVWSSNNLPYEVITDTDDVAGVKLVLDPAEILAGIGSVLLDGTAGKYLFAPQVDRHHDGTCRQLEARWCGLSGRG